MPGKDYYTLLGISKNASSEDIRKAYRAAARTFHPDVNKSNGAEEQFKAIGEAYEVLKDEKTRKLYDRFGHNWKEAENAQEHPGGYSGFAGGNPFAGESFHYENRTYGAGEDLDDILSQLFGQAGSANFYQQGTNWQNTKAEKTRPPTFELSVTVEDLFYGSVRYLSLGVTGDRGLSATAHKELKVTIPKGVKDGSIIRLAGTGGIGQPLHIRLTAQPHDRYSLDGYDLKTVVAVSPWELILGAKIPVKTMTGVVKLTVPKGSGNGKQLRIKGKGLPRKDGGAGDLIVVLEVCMPTELSEKEEKIVRSLAGESSFDPRKKHPQSPAPTKVVA